jgi:hypothetical protein
MAFLDDLRRIYQREKEEYGKKQMIEQDTQHPEYEFEEFKEWCEARGYSNE